MAYQHPIRIKLIAIILIGYYTVLCTLWKDIVRVCIVLKPRIGRDAWASRPIRVYNTIRVQYFSIFPRFLDDGPPVLCTIWKNIVLVLYCKPVLDETPRRLVQYGASIQYRLVQYLSTLYIIYFKQQFYV
jgi:hypothetical protein